MPRHKVMQTWVVSSLIKQPTQEHLLPELISECYRVSLLTSPWDVASSKTSVEMEGSDLWSKARWVSNFANTANQASATHHGARQLKYSSLLVHQKEAQPSVHLTAFSLSRLSATSKIQLKGLTLVQSLAWSLTHTLWLPPIVFFGLFTLTATMSVLRIPI